MDLSLTLISLHLLCACFVINLVGTVKKKSERIVTLLSKCRLCCVEALAKNVREVLLSVKYRVD